MRDLISRQAAIDAFWYLDIEIDPSAIAAILEMLKSVPSAQPEPSEITDEQAILHLQSTGWMQNHDREVYESGLREQLADDSGSYDSLIPYEDTISRHAALDALRESRLARNPVYMTTAMQVIEDLPSAQPESEERKAESAQNVPIEDLISRKAAIDALWEIRQEEISDGRRFHDYCSLSTAVDVIKDLPSSEPEPKWIPVSERLPEKYGNYLISIHGEDEPDIGTINPNDKRGWSLCDAKGFHWASDKKLIVTAWMPLPEPYMEERRTDAV